MQKSNIEEDFMRNIFCDTNNVGIGIYNASAVQDKAPNKMLSANDDRNDSSDIETRD